jgi:hypothetical protein
VFAPGKSLVKVQSEILDFFILGELHIVYMDQGHVSLHLVNVMWTDLDPLAFILHLWDKIEDMKDSSCEELEHVFVKFLKYHMQLLGYSSAEGKHFQTNSEE